VETYCWLALPVLVGGSPHGACGAGCRQWPGASMSVTRAHYLTFLHATETLWVLAIKTVPLLSAVQLWQRRTNFNNSFAVAVSDELWRKMV